MTESEDRPALVVFPQDATPEEIAALLAVLAASGTTEPPKRRTPAWSAPARGLRQPHHAGPGAWRASGLPR